MAHEGMISVVIPTLNAETDLAATLAALIPAAVDGLIREVIVADGGSTDRTLRIAENTGVEVVTSPPGRGGQLRAGAARARHPWLLFLHADTELSPGWEAAAAHFMEKVDHGRIEPAAAAFRFRLLDEGWKPRVVETAVAARCGLLKLPFGDQGLLLPRSLYEAAGGYRAMALMEDVDLVRRIGRRRIHILRADATTSARRFRADGYVRRVLRNQACLALYAAGVSPERIARVYEGRSSADVPVATTRARGAP